MTAQLAGVSRETAERRRPGRPPKPKVVAPRPRRKHGTGSITVQKTGRVFALDVRDAAGARAHYEAIGESVEDRYRDAEAWLAGQILTRKRLAGLAPETVQQYLERWLWQTHRTGPSSTHRIYRANLARATSVIGDVLVSALTPEIVDRVTDRMLADDLSARYCRMVRSTLRTAFGKLVPRVLLENPVGEYGRPLPIPKRRPNVLDEADAGDFERQALTTRWGLLWVLAIRYGLRSGELRALRRGDLDVARSELHVRHGLRSGRQLADTKNHQERVIRIVPALTAALVAFWETSWSSPSWIFAQANGSALTVDDLRNDFQAIVEAVNARRHKAALADGHSELRASQTALPRLTPHGLRHTAATLMLRGSATRRPVAIAKVSAILGHHDPSFTYRMYGWSVPSDDAVVDAAIGSLMSALEVSS